MKNIIKRYNNWKNTPHSKTNWWFRPTNVEGLVAFMDKIGYFKLIGIKS